MKHILTSFTETTLMSITSLNPLKNDLKRRLRVITFWVFALIHWLRCKQEQLMANLAYFQWCQTANKYRLKKMGLRKDLVTLQHWASIGSRSSGSFTFFCHISSQIVPYQAVSIDHIELISFWHLKNKNKKVEAKNPEIHFEIWATRTGFKAVYYWEILGEKWPLDLDRIAIDPPTSTREMNPLQIGLNKFKPMSRSKRVFFLQATKLFRNILVKTATNNEENKNTGDYCRSREDHHVVLMFFSPRIIIRSDSSLCFLLITSAMTQTFSFSLSSYLTLRGNGWRARD